MAPDHPVFRQVAALASPQLFLARRPWDEKAERLRTAITVDEVRALKGFFELTAADGGRRVAIVDAADELNASAANALLKILEEPPSRSVLLLVSHRPAGLLPTIRSRCRELRCAPLAPAALAAALAAAGAEAADDPRLATLAGGSVAAALDLVEGGGLELYAEIVALLARRAARPPPARRARRRRDGARRRRALRADPRPRPDRARPAGARRRRGCRRRPSRRPRPSSSPASAPRPRKGRLWATLAPALAERSTHARAVNLDPAQVILDTFLQIDAAAAEARAHAA